jgi:hypothetical protein
MKSMKYLLRFVILAFIVGTVSASCSGQSSRKRGGSVSSQIDTTKIAPPDIDVKLSVNVYIENSGSMDGYINGNSNFKGAIRDLLVMLKYHYDAQNMKIFFINSEIHPTAIGADLTAFAQNINTLWKVGDKKDSKLNNIFKQVLDRTDNQTISILFSDYIYSIAGRNTADLLSNEKSLTKDVFLSKWKQDKVQLATTIVKMKSNFKGKYFPYTGDQYNFPIDMERPYYICVIANQEILNDFNQKIELKAGKIEGYENKYVLSSEDPKGIYWSVLQSTYNKGRFRPLRRGSGHGIEDVNLARSGENLTFAIAVDFSKVQVEDDYISNPANYTVTTDNFTVVKAFPIDTKEIKANDLVQIQANNPTHIIVLEAKTKSVTDVAFVLKKQMPQWVNNSNTEDDTDTNKLVGTTFGLKYWVEGIAEAYETIYPNNKNYFECSIAIK